MVFTGKVVDAITYEPLPGATVELWYKNVLLTRGMAAANGVFSLTAAATPDRVVITNASYNSYQHPYNEVADDNLFPLERNVVEGAQVIVESVIKNVPWWAWVLGGLAFLLLVNDKKRR